MVLRKFAAAMFLLGADVCIIVDKYVWVIVCLFICGEIWICLKFVGFDLRELTKEKTLEHNRK